ncbi:class I glutamine amidotransferase-like protein [Penicillium cosmopolitanum]|uniref:Class I glutamine amidotransferase-like protein n=1 Tax=Penicillium cosmopolitanum TaxID=1131564 RepID=A0A9W9VY03_9EURO|nr:class I glutamine amidotransferase-like protein [Penicillium cosmopolitanum]KAJ5391230.1 class I glutamine amidotransferase-like protein [Penicillium cosmopolitanum]
MTETNISSNPEALRIGVALYPGFEALDAFGPLNCLNDLSRTESITLSVLASTLDPVSTKTPAYPAGIGQSIVPTHTFANAPALDVLLVPGGQGSRGSSPVVLETIAFIRDSYPSLKYLITVCTGAGLAARAGVLDGRRATTNKKAWKDIIVLGPEVKWVARARWVTDGNIWTSSGVSAGIDVTLAWIEELFGKDKAKVIADGNEYTRHEDPDFDPFAELYGLA